MKVSQTICQKEEASLKRTYWAGTNDDDALTKSAVLTAITSSSVVTANEWRVSVARRAGCLESAKWRSQPHCEQWPKCKSSNWRRSIGNSSRSRRDGRSIRRAVLLTDSWTNFIPSTTASCWHIHRWITNADRIATHDPKYDSRITWVPSRTTATAKSRLLAATTIEDADKSNFTAKSKHRSPNEVNH